MSNRKNAGVGYRLSFNYLKANRFVDAIDIGKEVMKVQPAMSKIKVDIINKARESLRI
jgi:tetratricopeptide repeat protein 21B